MTTDDRDRRQVLADAAIGLVARGGMRGLTHRAVDAEAHLPQGTTSAYFRTRSALILAVVHRLAEIDAQELARRQRQAGVPLIGGAQAPTPAPAPTPEMLDWLAGEMADLVVHLTTTARTRTLARYNCILETTHRPELHELLRYRDATRARTADVLRWAGAPDPAQRAREYMAALDGIILDRILDPASVAEPPHAAVRRLLEVAVGGSQARAGASREPSAGSGPAAPAPEPAPATATPGPPPRAGD